jgi:ABC-type transport system involved in multi-copper enzyme maturation permease subunit
VKTTRIIYHLARADFFERTRRYSFLVMLGLVLWIGYITASGQFAISVGPNYVGAINSAWVGVSMALSAVFILGLVGFYIVKGSVARDYTTGVGQIMATTPMSRLLYMAGKWLSNFAVLGITILILVLAGIVMALWFGDGGLNLAALVAPLLLISLPYLGLVAALAVLFESVAWLRGGLGNILYAIFWLTLISVTTVPALLTGSTLSPYADITGIQIITDSVTGAARAAYSDAGLMSFGAGLVMANPQSFPYNGIQWAGDILLSRLLLLLLAVGLVMVAAALFDRFDPARLPPVKRRAATPEPAPAVAVEPVPAAPVRLTPLSGAQTRFRFAALLVGELKLFVKGQRWWWYAVAAGLVVWQLSRPAGEQIYPLILAWVWPALILSGLGCREKRFDTRQIVFSAPRPLSQLPAGWLSAVLVMALLGSGSLLRFVLAGEFVAVLGWLTAIVFVPSLALALGTLTGSGKVFEALYVLWMYGLIQQMAAIDFAGLVPDSRFYWYVAAAIGLLAVAGLVRGRQLRGM